MKSTLQFYTVEEIPPIIRVIGLTERILAVLGIIGITIGVGILVVLTSSLKPSDLLQIYGSSSRAHILLVRGAIMALLAIPPILLLWVIPYFLDGRNWARLTVLYMSLLHTALDLASFSVARKSLVMLVVAMVQGCVFAYCAYSKELKAYFQIREQIRQHYGTKADEDPEK